MPPKHVEWQETCNMSGACKTNSMSHYGTSISHYGTQRWIVELQRCIKKLQCRIVGNKDKMRNMNMTSKSGGDITPN